MLVLLETAAGFAVFKLLDEKKLQSVDNLFEDFATPESASKIVELKGFKKFCDSAEALQAGVSILEGKVCKPLKKILKKVYAEDANEQLLVLDAKLGNSIKDKLGFNCVSNNNVGELMRCIKSQFEALVPGFQESEMASMALGLAHNLARYKMKFSPDKVDTMIVQAISLLDDIDKELNNYVMRTREWYGWHFPELGKIITDNIAYIKTVMVMGTRDRAVDTNFSEVLPEDLEARVKEAAEVSMGTEITDDDLFNIHTLCSQVVDLSEYRGELYEYLKNRMHAIAPNLTILVGDIVGARLISHAGSLMNLAKHPASTIQIIGAEKALFRALKTRHSTPKYGLIYHAQMVGQTSTKNKGKMSRMLAAKAALACRYDALGEETNIELGTNTRAKLASRIRMLEDGKSSQISGKGKMMARFDKYEQKQDVSQYHNAADSTMVSSSKRKFENESTPESKPKKMKLEVKEEPTLDESIDTEQGEKKKKKKKKKQDGDESIAATPVKVEAPLDESMDVDSGEKKKKKKKKQQDADDSVVMTPIKAEPEPEVSSEKKKKKKKQDVEEAQTTPVKIKEELTPVTSEKKKKKKSKKTNDDE